MHWKQTSFNEPFSFPEKKGAMMYAQRVHPFFNKYSAVSVSRMSGKEKENGRRTILGLYAKINQYLTTTAFLYQQLITNQQPRIPQLLTLARILISPSLQEGSILVPRFETFKLIEGCVV